MKTSSHCILLLCLITLYACGSDGSGQDSRDLGGELRDLVDGVGLERDSSRLPDLDSDGGDLGLEVRDAGQVEDATPVQDLLPPRLLTVFHSRGRVILRFDEVLAQDSDPVVTITGSDLSTLEVSHVEPWGRTLIATLADPDAMNPELAYHVMIKDVTDEAGNPVAQFSAQAQVKEAPYLALLWLQDQPEFTEPFRDQLSSPWVRKETTRDYLRLAMVLQEYPGVHLTTSLSAPLLRQLKTWYLDRLGPFIDPLSGTMDVEGFLAAWEGRTDPWIDLLLQPTPSPEDAAPAQLDLLYQGAWSCFSTPEKIMARFPQYVEIRYRNPLLYTAEDFLLLKILFELAWFDLSMLRGPVSLSDGLVVDLSDIVEENVVAGDDGEPFTTFTVTAPSEAVARRLLVEEYKMMLSLIPAHQAVAWRPETGEGQLELVTTPGFSPILPLLFSTDLARNQWNRDYLPEPPFAWGEDALTQITLGQDLFEDLFGWRPQGLWPPEAAMSEEVIPALAQAGLGWFAAGEPCLEASLPEGDSRLPYRVDPDLVSGSDAGGDQLAVFFRNTRISDDLGFKLCNLPTGQALDELLVALWDEARPMGNPGAIISVMTKGDCLWDCCDQGVDEPGFLRSLYALLEETGDLGEVVTVTMGEYLSGDPVRQIPAHPAWSLPELEPLLPESWTSGFTPWIGEPEELAAWEMIIRTRADLAQSHLPLPAEAELGDQQDQTWHQRRAWLHMLAAEDSKWLWFFGQDIGWESRMEDKIDQGFRRCLQLVYEHMNQALVMMGEAPIPQPPLPSIMRLSPRSSSGPFETMPTIDGIIDPVREPWEPTAGRIQNYDQNVQTLLDLLYWGWDQDALYLGLTFREPLLTGSRGINQVAIYLSHEQLLEDGSSWSLPANQVGSSGQDLDMSASWELLLDLGDGQVDAGLSLADGQGGWSPVETTIEAAGPGLDRAGIEVRIPFEDLQTAAAAPLELRVLVFSDGQLVDSAPSPALVVFPRLQNLVPVTFECDVSGQIIPLNSWSELTNPPPPQGQGLVFITGDYEVLGDFVPNLVPLLDDGLDFDRQEADQVWSRTFNLPRGAVVSYRYTAGLPQDLGKWLGTEEYPLTTRTITIPSGEQYARILVTDIFADRPEAQGEQAPHTMVLPLME